MKFHRLLRIKVVIATCALILASAISAPASAASIGVNFEYQATWGSAANSLLPTDSAGLVAQQNWNNVANIGTGFGTTSGSVGGFQDSNGNATGVSLNWNNVNNTFVGDAPWNIAPTSADESLFYGVIEGMFSVGPSGPNLTVAGVGFALYDVIVYLADSPAGVTVDGSTLFYDPTIFSSVGYVAATSTSSSSTPIATYAMFSGLTSSSFNIDFQKLSGNRAAVAGFQIVEVATVPLPAALPLFLVGLGGLGFASRRRKSA